jgi:sugar phosphate isomerase/epimerase
MINRRTFLAQTGLATAGLMIKPDLVVTNTNKKIAGLQLYSLRDYLPKDLKDVIAKVAVAGYKEVETFGYNVKTGYWGLQPKRFNQILKDNGLNTPSGHYNFNEYFINGAEGELENYLEVAQIMGQEYIIIPSLNERILKTEEDFKNIADKMNKLAELIKKSGFKLAYHNHNFEWKVVGNTTFYDTLLNYTDPALVFMEMDIFWVISAGQDPIVILNKYKGRFRFVHIKDRDKANPDLNIEIGKGNIDFRHIIPTAKTAGVKHFVMEQENFTAIDPFISIKESADYIKNILKV